MYVANEGSSSVYALNATTNALLYTIGVSSKPIAEVFDPANDNVYVADYGTDKVSVISPADTAPTSLKVADEPITLLYDPANTEVLSAGFNSGNVSAINSTTGAVTELAGFDDPVSMVYDTANGDVYALNYGNFTATVINSKDVVVGWITFSDTCGNPGELAYDPSNQTVWYSDCYANQIDVVSGTSIVAQVSVTSGGSQAAPGITTLVYDPSSGNMYLAGTTANVVSLITSKTYKVTNIPMGSEPGAIGYDPDDKEMFVSCYGSAEVTAILVTSVNTQLTIVSTKASPGPMAYDPVQSSMWITDYGSASVSTLAS